MKWAIALVAAFLTCAAASPQSGKAKDKKGPATAGIVECLGEDGEQRLVRVGGGSAVLADEVRAAGAEVDTRAAAVVAAVGADDPPKPDAAPRPASSGSTRPKTKAPPKKATTPTELTSKCEALAQAVATWRILQLIEGTAEAERVDVAQEYLNHPGFARALGLVVDLSAEDAGKVQRVARLLMQERSAVVEQVPELAAAVAVVCDTPVVAQANENMATGPGPLAVMDHFCRNERKLSFGIRDVPAEVWVYVVDVAASEQELQWAVRQFAGARDIGSLYDEVEYDFEHLEKGTPKKVTQAGWNLPNILKHGGVCADQAYFCATVSKAVGAPAVVTVGRDGSISHAWVGYAMRGRGGPSWNEWGRFGGYEGVEGMIQNPQTGRAVSSTIMPMLTEYGRTPAQDRRLVAGLRIAADRWLSGGAASAQGAAAARPAPVPAGAGSPAATPSAPATKDRVDGALTLARLALRLGLTDSRTWDVVARAALTGQMSEDQKARWSDDVIILCGDNYPEFCWRMIEPMVNSLPDPKRRMEVLDSFAGVFSARGDIVGQILMKQAKLYEGAGDMVGAGRCYERILARHANDGPFAVDALVAAATIMRNQGNALGMVSLCQRAFKNMEPPKGVHPTFAQQTNWYRCGVLLMDALRAAGQSQQADHIRNQMDSMMK